MQHLKRIKAEHSSEEGFTLIELLVVILIIGVLAAIAIPIFSNQRKTANDAAAESDARNAATVVEEYIASHPKSTTLDANYIRSNSKKSEGVGVSVYGTPNHYCITGVHTNGKRYLFGMTFAENGGKRPYYLYSSIDGGSVKNDRQDLTPMPCNNNGFSL